MKRAAHFALQALTLSTAPGRVAVLGAFLLIVGIAPASLFAAAPKMCLWSHITRHACPACGTLRALSACLKGGFAEAWRLNANVVVVLPTIVAVMATDLRHVGAAAICRTARTAQREMPG